MKNVYIACGLTHVPREEFNGYAALIHSLAATLHTRGIARVRYALRDSDPQLALRPAKDRARLCYEWDRDMVLWADVLVADVTYPSIGLGIELQIAAARATPTLLCFRHDERHRARPVEYRNPDASRHSLQIGEGYVSLMALGLPTVRQVIPYTSSDEAIQSVCAAMTNPIVLSEE
ncbi:hypothetical protein ACN6A1_05225 [Myxococcus virescens]|uniref:hypothetical protein n=1 Tax=Myxococcus virescens TaxID=83456 RepID=UPI003DA54E03